MKRVFSFILSAALLLFMPAELFGITAYAATSECYTYEVHDGKATITGCTSGGINVIDIPQTIEGYPVVSIGAHAFEDCADLIQVTIPEGVETIAEYAFYQCYNLDRLYLPDSLISIGEKAFCNCKSLETVEFGDGLKVIGNGTFSFCKKLDFYLELPDSLESIGEAAFYDCDTLETVLLPKSLKDLGSKAFAMCGRLDYIYIPDGVTRIGSQVLYQSACYYDSSNWYGDAFYMGMHLLEAKKSISGSYSTLRGIATIAEGAFKNCNSLTEVILPDSLQIIGVSAFESCDNLQSITIPSGVTTIGDRAFYECKAATDIQFSDSVVYLGQDAFTKTGYYNNAENWENNALYVGDHLVSCKPFLSGAFQVRQGTKTIVNGAMKELTNITELTLPDTLTTIGDEAVAGCTALTKVTISDGVTTIGEKAFYDCSALKTVYLGKEVSQIGSGAFGQCSNLESITVHSENETYRSQNNCLIRIQDKCLVMGCKTSQIPQDGSVTSIGAFAFEGCVGLTEITIPDTVLTIGEGAFRDCNVLTTVNLGNGVQVVGKRAFEECDALSQIDMGQSVHTICDYGFAYNQQLKQVEFPASLRYLGEEAFSNGTGIVSVDFQEGLLSIGVNCFAFCENLMSLHLPDSLEEIKDGAFYSCEKIATLSLGSALTAIGSAAFYGCEALSVLIIPDNVQTIGSSAFYECISLQQVDLGQVKKIEYSAFGECRSLTEIHIPASVTEIGDQVFSYCVSMERMTVSPQNVYYHSQGNCIINTQEKYLAFGCKNSIIPADGSVTSLDGYAFEGCTGLKSIVVPDKVTRICACTFEGCSGLTEMQLPFLGGEDYCDNYFGYIFGARLPVENDSYVPTSLKRVVITGGTFVGNSCFLKCSGLQEIVLPETIATIGYSAFENCRQLQRVVLPGNLEKLKDAAIFAGAPNAMLYISAGQENTKALAESKGIPYQVGGLITFTDENGQCIDKIWFPYGEQIVTPDVPEKPADANYTYTISWEPIPGDCTGNQTIQLRHIVHWIGGDVRGDFNGDNEVNNLDVEYLLWHTLFPDSYPVQFIADFNNDGEVNNLDVEYLLWHTLFPETYPV